MKLNSWAKHLFIAVHYLLITVILLASAALYIAFRPDGLSLLKHYLLEPLGIEYTRSEGSLLDGFTLHNLRSDTMEAKTLTLTYSLTRILEGKHIVDRITIEGLRLHLDDFVSDDNDTPWPFPTFVLKEVIITNLQLLSAYPVELDIYAKNGSYDGDFLNFASLRATIQSRYASAALQGRLHNNLLKGSALLYPNAKELAPYSGKFTDLPKSITVRIDELSTDRAQLSAAIDHLNLKQDPLTRAEKISLHFNYRFEDPFFDADAHYLLRRQTDAMQTRQKLRYRFEGETDTRFEGVITSKRPLPAHTLRGELTDNAEGISGIFTVEGAKLAFSSDDYDRYRFDIDTAHSDLKFLPILPPSLQSSPLKLNAHGDYFLSRNRVEGSGKMEHNHGTFIGRFSAQEAHFSADGNLTLPPDAPMWKNWGHTPPEHLTLSLLYEGSNASLNLGGESLDLSFKGDTERWEGSGNYLGSYFDFKGTSRNGVQEIWIDSETPSLFATLVNFKKIELHKNEYYDAEIRSKTHITLSDTLRIRSDITVPWYAAVLDSQRAFGGTDGRARLTYVDGNITIDNYRFEAANHSITTDKPSRLHLNASGELIIDQFWIYDTLLLTGAVNLDDLRTSLRLRSERFRYTGPEGEARMAADIMFTRDGEANNNLAGTLTILDATITYLPLQQFKVMDDDIIIIQDVRPPGTTKLAMNLHVVSDRPIHYQTKELDLLLNSDVTLWKDPLGPMQILGMVSIPSGSAKTSGKHFDIKPSEIYFGGDVPLNPYLNLTIGHEVDYKKILIYVTHTLDSPIFLFTSDPVMSQNDIMSYILFGGPANATAGGDGGTATIRADATNFMLGSGFKGLINGATKLQIDTMNILTTGEGGMGFEVGARINKDLRVLYKNDTVSSVLIQYTLNRWLRLDADVHELGQGIKAVYIKDFHDFLPHNKPKK